MWVPLVGQGGLCMVVGESGNNMIVGHACWGLLYVDHPWIEGHRAAVACIVLQGGARMPVTHALREC